MKTLPLKLHRNPEARNDASRFLLDGAHPVSLLGEGDVPIKYLTRADEGILFPELAARHVLQTHIPSQAPLPEEIVLVDAQVQLGIIRQSAGVV